jgi:hypothetical protein
MPITLAHSGEIGNPCRQRDFTDVTVRIRADRVREAPREPEESGDRVLENDLGASLLFVLLFVSSIFALPLVLAWLEKPHQARWTLRAVRTRLRVESASEQSAGPSAEVAPR